MLLRSTLEAKLPLKPDEEHLSDQARRVIFRGSYLWPQKITDVLSSSNINSRSKDVYPYGVKITRQNKDGIKHITGDEYSGTHWSEPLYDVVDEMSNPQALNRANRVERIGRRIKSIVAGSAVVGLASLISVLAVTQRDSVSNQHPAIEACSSVADGTETLVPVAENQVPFLQKAGEVVCRLADNDYLALTPVTTG